MSCTYIRLTGLTESAAKNLPGNSSYDMFPDAARQCCLTGVTIPGANEQGSNPSTAVSRLLKRLGLLAGDPGDGRGVGLQSDSWGVSRGRDVPTKVIRTIEA